ncbi:MAG: methyltransferase [Deferrisomatales bacterium]
MTFEDLRSMAAGFQPAKLLLEALDVGVFDLLEEGPLGAAEVAQRFGLDSRATRLMLDALVGQGLLELGDERYRNAEPARLFLVKGSPEYRGEILRHLHNTWEDWNELGQTWKTGRPTLRRKTQQLPSTAEGTRHFILGMENLTRDLAPHLAERLPLEGRTRLLDLGGGPGNYSLAFVQRWPGLEAVHFDLAPTSEIAREFLGGKPGAERISFLEGDFLSTPLGEGYDFVWASQILHMLGEEEVQALLGRISQALVGGGLVAAHDHFLEEDRTRPPTASLFGVHMLVATARGRTYSIAEVEQWMRNAGLEPQEVVDYGGPARVLLGRKLPGRGSE